MSFGTLSEINHFGQDNASLPPHTGNILQEFSNNGFIANNSQNQTSTVQTTGINYDGRRMRNKSNVRKTVDYNASVANWLHNRTFQRDFRDRRAIQPDPLYNTLMVPPSIFTEKPVNCLCTRPIRMAMNKVKCPIFVVKWTPEGRRLITGASSGEFTLWNGLTFSFETILQAHDLAVRSMVWSHNDQWMVTADHGGYVKYWQSNMNNVKMYQIHKEAVRGLSFSPSDLKFASCSDDSTVRIWDFLRCHEEKIFRGHGADVRCVDWHPEMGIVASGSRDTQQPVKLWDVKSGTCLSTIHAHKHAIMDLKWNRNGNWLLTASRDHLLKLFDLRNINEEVQVFRGHKKEATTIAWHPIHENLFASGGSDGSIMYWMVGNEKGLGGIENGHDTMVWSLDWHPVGHILASGSNDHTTKFWTRNRPGDMMRDKYNLNTLPIGSDENDADADIGHGILPGLDKDEEVNVCSELLIPGIGTANEEQAPSDAMNMNDSSLISPNNLHKKSHKHLHYKSVPREFEKAWKEGTHPNSMTGQQADFGFSRPDKDAMTEADETTHETPYHDSRSRHIPDMDGYYDENAHMADDFHGHANFPDRQGHPDYPGDNFYQDDPAPHVRNDNWNHGNRRPNFVPFGRNHFKPPPPNAKRGYDDVDDNHHKRHFEFGEDYPRREGNPGFGFRGRGRPNRGGHRGFTYH